MKVVFAILIAAASLAATAAVSSTYSSHIQIAVEAGRSAG